MNIRIVRATTDDTKALLEMQKICFAPHLQRYQDFETNPSMATLEMIEWQIHNDYFFKIYLEDLWVGAVNIKKLDETGNYKLHVINVLPEHQGKGIGQATIKEVQQFFSDAKSWCLETLEDMPNNRHVYEKMGYKFTGETLKINDKLTIVFYFKGDYSG